MLTQTNTTNAFSAGGLRADVAGNPALPSSERTLGRWFNTDAFTQPATFTFGNSRRGILRGDGVVNADLSLAKNVALGRARSLQLRVELFNAFNQANFDLPGTPSVRRTSASSRMQRGDARFSWGCVRSSELRRASIY